MFTLKFRLIQLYNPKTESYWLCQNESKAKIVKSKHHGPGSVIAEDHLTLQYFVVEGKSSSTSARKEQFHTTPELLDFQSNIVLTKTSEKNNQLLQDATEKFLNQFSVSNKDLTKIKKQLIELFSELKNSELIYQKLFKISLNA